MVRALLSPKKKRRKRENVRLTNTLGFAFRVGEKNVLRRRVSDMAEFLEHERPLFAPELNSRSAITSLAH